MTDTRKEEAAAFEVIGWKLENFALEWEADIRFNKMGDGSEPGPDVKIRPREQCDRITTERRIKFMRDTAYLITSLRQQNEALREIVSESASAIGNGACIAPQCSIEFMQGLPREIALHTDTLRQQIEEALASSDEANHTLVDKYRDPKSGAFSFPDDVGKIIRKLERERDGAGAKALEEAAADVRGFWKGDDTREFARGWNACCVAISDHLDEVRALSAPQGREG